MAKLSRSCQSCRQRSAGLTGVAEGQKRKGSKEPEHTFAIEVDENTVAAIVMCRAKCLTFFKVLECFGASPYQIKHCPERTVCFHYQCVVFESLSQLHELIGNLQ